MNEIKWMAQKKKIIMAQRKCNVLCAENAVVQGTLALTVWMHYRPMLLGSSL